jgi:hypothetical protein
MKSWILISMLIVISFSSCATVDDEIYDNLRKVCGDSEKYFDYLLDSNITASEIRVKALEEMKKYKYERKAQTAEHFELFHNKEISIVFDTILKPYSYDNCKYDSIRIIEIRNFENKSYYFYFTYENERWKIFNFNMQIPIEIAYHFEMIKGNFAIVDSIIANPEKLWNYTKKKNDTITSISSNNENLGRLDILTFTKAIQFIKHNYQNGYLLDLHELKGIPSIEHHIYIRNKENKRPLDVVFDYNDSLRKFILSDFWFYGVPKPKVKYLYRYEPDSLTNEELSENRKLMKRILSNPYDLVTILLDTNLADLDYDMKIAIDSGYIDRMTDYIKENFSNNYSISYDSGRPDINPHFMPQGFDNWHFIYLENNINGKKLHFTFSDCGSELYKFKLIRLFSYNSEIDGIDWENYQEATP